MPFSWGIGRAFPTYRWASFAGVAESDSLLLVSYYKSRRQTNHFCNDTLRQNCFGAAERRRVSVTIALMSNLRVLIPASDIQKRIAELGAQIDRDYPAGEPIYLIGVLKGACIFLADLARATTSPARIEFIGISSYGKGKKSSGEVRVTKDLDVSVEGHHVIIVEDILDTGITLSYLVKLMAQRKPKSLRIATLLDKPERRQSPVQVDYVGFKIPDEFVVGFGLDYAEDYRNLRDVCVLEQ
jgi:hypoxanthine phosphoribosyltransferase